MKHRDDYRPPDDGEFRVVAIALLAACVIIVVLAVIFWRVVFR